MVRGMSSWRACAGCRISAQVYFLLLLIQAIDGFSIDNRNLTSAAEILDLSEGLEMLHVVAELPMNDSQVDMVSKILQEYQDGWQGKGKGSETQRSSKLGINFQRGRKCGIRGTRTRIIGGAEAKRREFPWQVKLHGIPMPGVCGGVLISDEWVLTAAHCLRSAGGDRITSHLDVYVGAHDITKDPIEDSRLEITASEWIVHPGFGSEPISIDNDIALIRIPSIGVVMPDFMPACLPTRNMQDESINAVAAGWGRTAQGTGSPVLRYINATTLRPEGCFKLWPGLRAFMTKNMVCIDPVGGTNMVCNGDSGGQLVREVNGVYHVIGLTSFGSKESCQSGRPGVFTRVKNYVGWICENTGICF